MGGRSGFPRGRESEPMRPDRELWVSEVSDSRLQSYSRMLSSSAAPVRLDGSPRISKGDYFKDLIQSEKKRRGLE